MLEKNSTFSAEIALKERLSDLIGDITVRLFWVGESKYMLEF